MKPHVNFILLLSFWVHDAYVCQPKSLLPQEEEEHWSVDVPGTPQRAPVCEGGWPRHWVFFSPLCCQRSKYKCVRVCIAKCDIVFVTHRIMALKSQKKKICLKSLSLYYIVTWKKSMCLLIASCIKAVVSQDEKSSDIQSKDWHFKHWHLERGCGMTKNPRAQIDKQLVPRFNHMLKTAWNKVLQFLSCLSPLW